MTKCSLASGLKKSFVMFVMKKTWMLGIVLCMLLGCQKQEPTSSTQSTQDFKPKIKAVVVTLPPCSGRYCPQFEVKHVITQQKFINDTIDHAILDMLSTDLDVVVSSENFNQDVQHYADIFIKLDEEIKHLNANTNLSLVIDIKQLQDNPNLLSFELNTSRYLGGAHSFASQHYFNFDIKNRKQLTLDNILLPDQRQKLHDLAYIQFKKWVIAKKLSDNLTDYEQAWNFKLSQNFYLGEKGLVLQYGEYEIAPYIAGMPTFVLPYSQLKGIIKPQYVLKTI